MASKATGKTKRKKTASGKDAAAQRIEGEEEELEREREEKLEHFC